MAILPWSTSIFADVMAGGYKAMVKLREEGVIKAIGAGVNEWEMCQRFAEAGDFDCFLLAGRYTLLEQEPLDSFLPLCERRGIGIILGGPYNTGILATGAVEGAYYNYAAASPEIMERVRGIEAVCRRHGVPLASAALQFPFGHPAMSSVIPGARTPAEVTRTIDTFAHDIPSDLWADLKAEGHLREDAPVPGLGRSPAPPLVRPLLWPTRHHEEGVALADLPVVLDREAGGGQAAAQVVGLEDPQRRE